MKQSPQLSNADQETSPRSNKAITRRAALESLRTGFAGFCAAITVPMGLGAFWRTGQAITEAANPEGAQESHTQHLQASLQRNAEKNWSVVGQQASHICLHEPRYHSLRGLIQEWRACNDLRKQQRELRILKLIKKKTLTDAQEELLQRKTHYTEPTSEQRQLLEELATRLMNFGPKNRLQEAGWMALISAITGYVTYQECQRHTEQAA